MYSASVIITLFSPPKMISPKPIRNSVMPMVAMNRMMSGWLTSGRSTTRSMATASRNMTTERQRHARAAPARPFVQADQRQRREDDHDALREIEDARGFVDQHEAQRDQRVEHAGDQPLPQHLEQEIRRAGHVGERLDEDGMQKFHVPVSLARWTAPRSDLAGELREQAEQADDDEIERDDVVQQPRHDQDQDAGDERDQRRQRQGREVHVVSFQWATPR